MFSKYSVFPTTLQMGGDGATGIQQEHTVIAACTFVTRAGKMSVNAHRLSLRYTQNSENLEFEVFTKIRSLSPHLAIQLFQLVIKHLQSSVFVRFQRGVPFLSYKARDADKYTRTHRITVFTQT